MEEKYERLLDIIHKRRHSTVTDVVDIIVIAYELCHKDTPHLRQLLRMLEQRNDRDLQLDMNLINPLRHVLSSENAM